MTLISNLSHTRALTAERNKDGYWTNKYTLYISVYAKFSVNQCNHLLFF